MGTAPAPTMPASVRAALTITLVSLAIVAFAVIVGFGVYQTWTAPGTSKPTLGEGYLYLANALMALVGGIVAAAFGEQAPHNNRTPRHAALMTGLSLRQARAQTDPVAALAAVYAVTYFIVGIAACLTWALQNDNIPDLLRTLAIGFVGMTVGIVTGFFARR